MYLDVSGAGPKPGTLMASRVAETTIANGTSMMPPADEVGLVRFAPARLLVGYLQVVERDSPPIERNYLATIRDPRTVTFATRSGKWRRLAEEIAAYGGATLEVEPARPYWSAIRGRK